MSGCRPREPSQKDVIDSLMIFFISTGPIKLENEYSKARNNVNNALFTIDQQTTHGNTSRAIRHKKSKTLLRLNERIG